MPASRTGRLLEHVAVAALAALAWAVTWRALRVGDFPPLLPAAGLGLAYLMLRGGWSWLPLFAGACAGGYADVPTAPGALAVGAATFAPTLLAWRLARAARVRPDLGRVREVVALGLAAVAGAGAGVGLALPLAGVAGVVPAGGTLVFWERLAIGNVVGVVLFAIPVLASRMPGARWRGGRRDAEVALASGATLAVAAAVFLTAGSPSLRFLGLGLVVMPLLAWVTLRGHGAVATSLLAAVLLLAVAGAAQGLGPFGAIPVRIATRTIQAFGGAFGFLTALLAVNEFTRRRALRAAKEQAQRLHRVIEASNDGFWEWDAATDVVEASDRLARTFGYAPHEFLRTRADYTNRVHPDDVEAAHAAVEAHFEGRTDSYAIEYRLRHRDGRWVWVSDRGCGTERDASGRVLRASGTMTDITERKQAELALRASQEMFEDFMRHSPAIAFIRDRRGRLHWTNLAFQQFVWGRETPDYRRHSMFDLFPPEIAARLSEQDDEVLRSDRSVVAENHMVSEARDAWWLTVKFPIRQPEGEPLIGGMAVEITERRRMAEERRELEARMMEAQKLEGLGLLAGGIAHDFNNILTGILGHADLARLRAPTGSPLHESLEHIVAGSHAAAELTQQMLAYAGRGRVAMRPIALPELVTEMGHLLQVSIPKRVALRHDFGVGLPAIEGDEAQLRQVVMNLIVNAAESFGEARGSITVRVRAADCDADALRSRWASDEARPGPHVVLEVADTGSGMAPETLARIFDPFFSTKFTGRGLGLAAVLGIVRGHRGVIQVESTPGAGTTFRVHFPAAGPAVAAPAVAGDDTWRASGTALVVDDEPAVRGIAAAMLARLGFAPVLCAGGGVEGLARFRERAGEIRVVLLDLTMPDLDGQSVLREMRTIRPDACIVLSSGYGAAARDGDAPGSAGFVSKPYRLTELAGAVRAALEGAPAA